MDGFTQYAMSIWETIQDNKDIDLPTQREMLAIVRCEEISKDSYIGK
jgi:protein SEY1